MTTPELPPLHWVGAGPYCAVGGRLTVAVPGRRPVTASTRNWVGRTRLALAARRVGCPRALTPAARWVWRAFDALDYFLSKPEPGF